MIIKKLIYFLIALLSFQVSIAQDSFKKIDMVNSNWILPREATFERFDNRETLLLNGGSVGYGKKSAFHKRDY